MASISEIINYAKISQYLALYDRAKLTFFSNGNVPTEDLPNLIYQVRKSVEREYLQNYYPTSPQLEENANYLYNLCNRYIQQAIGIFNGGGGGIIVNPTNNNQYVYSELLLIVNGVAGQPVVNTSTYQNNQLIGAIDINEITINKQLFYIGTDYTFNLTTGTITLLNYIWNTGDIAVLSFNKKIA